MSDNNNDDNGKKLQGFVPFDNIFAELTEIKKVDQENKIKLVNRLSPHGGFYKYSLLLSNESSAPITEVKVKIKFPKFLEFSRSFPPSSNIEYIEVDKNFDQLNFEIDELEGDKKYETHFFYSPNFSSHKKGEISTNIMFVNCEDYVRMLSSENVEIIVDHVAIEKTLIAPSHLKEFSIDPDVEKTIRSFGIGIEGEMDYKKFYEILEEIAAFHHYQLIFTDEENYISWYFGSEIESKEQILLITQIKNRKLEFIVATKNAQLLVPIMMELSGDLKRRLLLTKLVGTEDQIYEMECKVCGSVLPYFPSKGKSVECTSCHSEQVIW